MQTSMQGRKSTNLALFSVRHLRSNLLENVRYRQIQSENVRLSARYSLRVHATYIMQGLGLMAINMHKMSGTKDKSAYLYKLQTTFTEEDGKLIKRQVGSPYNTLSTLERVGDELVEVRKIDLHCLSRQHNTQQYLEGNNWLYIRKLRLAVNIGKSQLSYQNQPMVDEKLTVDAIYNSTMKDVKLTIGATKLIQALIFLFSHKLGTSRHFLANLLVILGHV